MRLYPALNASMSKRWTCRLSVPIFLRMRQLQRLVETPGRRLLCVLLLRRPAVPNEAAGGDQDSLGDWTPILEGGAGHGRERDREATC